MCWHFGVFFFLIFHRLCVFWGRQQVLNWVLQEPSVFRLLSNPSALLMCGGAYVCGCSLCAAAKCQTVCVSNRTQGKVKRESQCASLCTYFRTVFLWVCVCICVYFCLCGCFRFTKTPQTGAFLTGSQISVYSCLQICSCCFCFSTQCWNNRIEVKRKIFPFLLLLLRCTFIFKYP